MFFTIPISSLHSSHCFSDNCQKQQELFHLPLCCSTCGGTVLPAPSFDLLPESQRRPCSCALHQCTLWPLWSHLAKAPLQRAGVAICSGESGFSWCRAAYFPSGVGTLFLLHRFLLAQMWSISKPARASHTEVLHKLCFSGRTYTPCCLPPRPQRDFFYDSKNKRLLRAQAKLYHTLSCFLPKHWPSCAATAAFLGASLNSNS